MDIYKNEAPSQPNTEQIVSWDKKYATGIELIDTQHRKLVSLTNELYRACLSGNDEAVFREAMKSMVTYVRFHFSAEQKLLERINFPGYSSHKKQHDTLIKNILDTVKDYREGKPFVPNNFVRTLKDWVFGHIAVNDKFYAAFAADQIKLGIFTEKQINGEEPVVLEEFSGM